MNDEGEIEAIELPAVHTEILMIRGTESGDWYFDNGIGLFNGPWPSKEICLIEYYRREHAERPENCTSPRNESSISMQHLTPWAQAN
jgi:hypothetical protein